MKSSIIYVFSVVIFHSVVAHISLTFPPARYPPLDYLDSVRTNSPCGVDRPANARFTTLVAGESLNVTWRMNYMHKGGYKLFLLNENGQPVQQLTSDFGFVNHNATGTWSQLVTIPDGVSCNRCIVQLERQAHEWGIGYWMWSCADVEVIRRFDGGENNQPIGPSLNACFNHGAVRADGGCECSSRYYGDMCQYETDCVTNSDCSGRGRCRENSGVLSPARVCYCSPPYYGKFCENQFFPSVADRAYDCFNYAYPQPLYNSHWTSANDMDPIPQQSTVVQSRLMYGLFRPDCYRRRNLTNNDVLYWRRVGEEMEFIIDTSSSIKWTGIGWRPMTETVDCKRRFMANPVPSFATQPPPLASLPSIQQQTFQQQPVQQNFQQQIPQQPIQQQNFVQQPFQHQQIINQFPQQPITNGQFPAQFGTPIPPLAQPTFIPNIRQQLLPAMIPQQPATERYDQANQFMLPELPDFVPQLPRRNMDRRAREQPRRAEERLPKSDQTKRSNGAFADLASAFSQSYFEQSLDVSDSPSTASADALKSFERKLRDSVINRDDEAIEAMRNAMNFDLRNQPSTSSATSPSSAPPNIFDMVQAWAAFANTTEAQHMFEQFYARYQRQHSVTNSNSNRPPSGDSSGITWDSWPNRSSNQRGSIEPVSQPEPQPVYLDVTGSPTPEQVSDTLHAMDCTDMVIMSTFSTFTRVYDAYTPDRSTPMIDETYGGYDSIRAAYGVEIDGRKVSMFRRQIQGDDMFDYTLSTSVPMHVVWAKGESVVRETGTAFGDAQNKYHADMAFAYHGQNRRAMRIHFGDD